MTTPPLLIGLDIGTTRLKAAVVDSSTGREVGGAVRATPWSRVPTGAELDGDELIAAIEEVCSAALDGTRGVVAGVGVCSMAETVFGLGEDGLPVYRGIAWYDTRGDISASEIQQTFGSRFTRITGLPATRLATIAKLRWLDTHGYPLGRASHWCDVASFVIHRLGGGLFSERTLASRTGIYDVDRDCWSSELLEWLSIDPSTLPQPSYLGTACGIARKPRSIRGAVLTSAGLDHVSAAVGVGALNPGTLLDSFGTAEALIRVTNHPLRPREIEDLVGRGITVGRANAPGRFCLIGAFESGSLLRRVAQLLGMSDDQLQDVDLTTSDMVMRVTADGTLELTRIGSDPSPEQMWAAALSMLEENTSPLIEAMSDVLKPHERAVLVGGWSRLPSVRAVKRRLLGARCPTGIDEAGALGAARASGVAAGVYANIDDIPGAHQEVYEWA